MYSYSILVCKEDFLFFQSSVVMQLERGSVESSSLDMKTTMTSPAGDSKLQAEGSVRSHPTNEEPVDGQLGKDVELQEQEIKEPIKAAKIHDFCFGIPFGKCISAIFQKYILWV